MLRILATLGSARPAVGLAFSAPQPTTAEDDHARGLTGWSPKPTQNPFELFRRDVAGPRTCGWYGDGFGGTSTITCPTGTCMAYDPSGVPGMVGCCASFNGGMDYQQCGWVNRCYDYLDIVAGLCDDTCQSNEFNRVCTVSSLPYCQSWTYPGAGAKDYGCDTESASTWITVSTDVADILDGTATAQIPFVPAAAAVTGWDGSEASETLSSTSNSRSSSISADRFTSTSLPSSSSSSKTVGVAAIVIILVILFGSLCIGGCIVAWFCARSKRNVAKWKTGSSVALIPTSGQQGAPLTPTNVVPPSSSYSGRPSYPSYFEQNAASQGGAAASYYDGNEHKTPAFTSTHSPVRPMTAPGTSAPPYSQPQSPQMAPGFASSQPYAPPQAYAQPYSPPQNGAVEAPANPAPRPNYAELG